MNSSMDKVIELAIEILNTFRDTVETIQRSFCFLQRYLDDEDATLYAKAWTNLEELGNVLEDNINGK